MCRARRLQELAAANASTASSSGLSVQRLSDAIRRIERSIESEMIDATDMETPHTKENDATVKVRLSDSQKRMALWLNALPIKKHVTWFPDVANSHAVIIVR